MSAEQSATVVAYGGGVNSTALLVGLHERGERPDAIVFADTGGERPETYKHLDAVRDWCRKVGFPDLVTVRATYQGEVETLEGNCHRIGALPSLAYGFKKCSQKFKHAPSDKWCRNAFPKGDIVKLIGFDTDESHRADRAPARRDRFVFRYPLLEWGWSRADCVTAIKRSELEVPGKSSCFFCPAMTVREIRALPCDLKARALAIEDAAKPNLRPGGVVGLGRRFSWRTLLESDAAQGDLFTPPEACECYDGGPSDE